MDRQLRDALEQVINYLDANGLRYAIVGGIALSYWNVSRFTYDIDIKLLVPNAEYATVRQLLRTRFPAKAREQAREHALIVPVSVNNVVIDFLLALPGYEELIIERAVRHDLDELQVWVCTAEDLIIQKVVASREKDWPDVEALLIEQWHTLDQSYVEDWLSQFSDALETPELLSRYLSLRGKIQRIIE